MGWLMGKHGLACDNLLSMEVVTADGRSLTASTTENEDLFWGLRGGSGNFGIVTSFEYLLHPVGPVLAGMILYPSSEAAMVLRSYTEFVRECPDELSTFAALMNTPDGEEVVAVIACHCGSSADGEKSVAPLTKFGTCLSNQIAPIRYTELQTLLDAGFPEGRLHYWKSNFIRTLSDRAIGAIVEYAARRPSPTTVVGLQQMHGVASRIGARETAFPHRYELHNFMIISNWQDPAESQRNVAWTREFSESMQPVVDQAVYVNDVGDEGEDRVRFAYGGNYQRLVAIKNKYDPTNFFRINQNIKPSV